MLTALIFATLVLVAIPGPNVALIVANTLRRGHRIGVLTVLGTTLGVSLQLMLVATGLATLLSQGAQLLFWVRLIGAGYLVFLGLRAWREPQANLDTEHASAESGAKLAVQGFAYAAFNPKTLLFNAAFLPQFIGLDSGAVDWVKTSCIYILVLFVGDLAWVALSDRARPIIARFGRLRSKLTGAFLVLAGVGLAVVRADP
jgi:threonine/homoserine/homoserine lactone efflux protein